MSQVVSLKKPPRTGTKGAPPAEAAIIPNTQKPASGTKTQLSVQVPVELRRAFKVYAAERDLDMGELFQAMYEEYRARHG